MNLINSLAFHGISTFLEIRMSEKDECRYKQNNQKQTFFSSGNDKIKYILNNMYHLKNKSTTGISENLSKQSTFEFRIKRAKNCFFHFSWPARDHFNFVS